MSNAVSKNIDKSKVDSIRIYAVSWNIMTRARLSEDDVRRTRDVYMEINDRYLIGKVIDSLGRLNCSKVDELNLMDVRLVVDFVMKDRVNVFYADKISIANRDSGESCALTKDFLNSMSIFLQNNNLH
jgi:hypothetical protein